MDEKENKNSISSLKKDCNFLNKEEIIEIEIVYRVNENNKEKEFKKEIFNKRKKKYLIQIL